MKSIIQKIIAKFFNSYYVRSNPYILTDIEKKVKMELDLKKEIEIKNNLENVTIHESSKFYGETIIHNGANEKAKILIGSDTHIRGELLVQKYGGQIQIGKNCYVGTGTKIWSGDSVTVGDNVLISHNCNIIDTNSHEMDYVERSSRYAELVKSGPWSTKGSIITKPIVIGDNVWISFNVTILKGVTIGEGAIIAANSVVTKDIPAFTLAIGNPAKIAKYI